MRFYRQVESNTVKPVQNSIFRQKSGFSAEI